MKNPLLKIELSFAERKKINKVIDDLAVFEGYPEKEIYDIVQFHSSRIPASLLKKLAQFREKSDHAALLVSGFKVSERIGPTPRSLRPVKFFDSPEFRENLFFLLLASRLGILFAWPTQQYGKIIHDVLPIREHKNMQIGSGSDQEITLHVEDAHSDGRAHFIGLLCLKNPGNTGTTLSVPDFRQLSGEDLAILQSEKFEIGIDLAHDIKRRLVNKIQVLSQTNQGYEIRIDNFFMLPHPLKKVQAALNRFSDHLKSQTQEVILQPGEALFVNNRVAVHGRRTFGAQFDGEDRWLKRVNLRRRDRQKMLELIQFPA